MPFCDCMLGLEQCLLEISHHLGSLLHVTVRFLLFEIKLVAQCEKLSSFISLSPVSSIICIMGRSYVGWLICGFEFHQQLNVTWRRLIICVFQFSLWSPYICCFCVFVS